MMKKIKKYKVILGVFLLGVVGIAGYFFIETRLNIKPVTQNTTTPPIKKPSETTPADANLFSYIEITNGCGPYYDTGICVNMRSGPGIQYPIVGRLRTGVVLQVEKNEVFDANGRSWYKIIFDKTIRYPERVAGDWYIASDPTSVRLFQDVGEVDLVAGTKIPKTKRIVVSISKEMLYAYDGNTLFLQDPVSTGLELTPTPAGTFTIFRKTPSRYMQGPLPGVSDQLYDLPGVPWDLYFTKDGAVIHGAYWHNHFGEPWSHGCINLSPQEAKKLYEWADIGTSVLVQN